MFACLVFSGHDMNVLVTDLIVDNVVTQMQGFSSEILIIFSVVTIHILLYMLLCGSHICHVDFLKMSQFTVISSTICFTRKVIFYAVLCRCKKSGVTCGYRVQLTCGSSVRLTCVSRVQLMCTILVYRSRLHRLISLKCLNSQ